MQPEKIILIPPTHEQTILEKSLADSFLQHLKSRNLTPWRPVEEQEKQGTDGQNIVQVEIDTKASQPELETLIDDFLDASHA